MICISINQESRRLALADLLNAGRQGDLLELRLDRFAKAADVAELLAVKPKPVIMTCRRSQDGGNWEGSEEERLALLRHCIISKADYVEIELDVADQIRPFPGCKRVISYTNLRETPADLAEIYEEARSKRPDIIKLMTLARTPEEAWPLVQILAKPALPTVAVGLGKPGLMLSILGKKMGSPWAYAALERGMEAYPGEPTVEALRSIYHFPTIERNTRLIGVTGFTELEQVTVGLLNSAMQQLNLPARCLPIGVGNARLFRKVMEAVRLAAVVVDEPNRHALLDIPADLDPAARQCEAVDLLLHIQGNPSTGGKVQGDGAWHGYNLLCRGAVAALEATLLGGGAARQEARPPEEARPPSGEKPLERRTVLVVGVNTAARALSYGIKKRGGALIIASHNRQAAHSLAQQLDCRFIQFEALYTTMHEIVVICDREVQESVRSESTAHPSPPTTHQAIHAGYLRSGMTVMDLTTLPRKSAFLQDAQARDCRVVEPEQILLELADLQTHLIAGQTAPRERLRESLSSLLPED
jgi:3-dehydroquinate dehydratase/shikimate dehydrogenase